MKNLLLSFLFLVSYNQTILGQISYTGCQGAITGPYPFTLSMSGTTGSGATLRNTYTSPTPGPSCGAGVCSFRIIWTGSQWEIQLSNNGGFSYDFILYTNTSASIPNPPDLTLGTWNAAGPCAGQAITTLSGDVQSTTTVMPVELTAFNVEEITKMAKLSWETASEINNDYFSIQKSTNGKDFQEIATQKGAGTTYEAQNYSYTDERPINGTNYYRLMQMDFDGSFSYSEIVSVDFGNTSTVSIFPNPAKERLQLHNEEKWNNMEVYIYNLNGQLVKQVKFDDADFDVALDIQDLRAGVYQLQLINNGQVTTERFVKE